ncbi:MAG: hypothetical protein H0U57_13080 [Tatlockia sp.]|nr:hypothetical protein [Tatlockia sp.]
MRVIEISDQQLRKISNEIEMEILIKKLPLLAPEESLSFEATNGNLYIIETDEDITEIQSSIEKGAFAGEWKILLDGPSYNEGTSLLQPPEPDLPQTQKDITINILKIALPITGVVAITVATNYVTSIFLGNYNTQLLASMAIIEALESPLSQICQFTLYPISPLIGHYKDTSPETVGKIMQQGYLVSMVASVPSLLIRYFSKSILLALKQPSSLVGHAEAYFLASMWGFPATILVSADEQLLLASDKKLLYVIMSLADLTVTLGLGYILMYGKLGFPELGMASLGYASAARSWLSFAVYKLYFIANQDFKNYKLFNLSVKNTVFELSNFLKISLPVSFQILSKSSFLFTSNMLLGSRYGVSTLVAIQVVSRYLSFANLPVQALALATSIQVGINLGQGNLVYISRYGNTGVLLGLCHTGLLFAISASLPKLLAKPFIDVNDPKNSATVDLLPPFFMVLMGAQMLEAIDTISVGALRGLTDTAAPMLIGIISTWGFAFPLVFVMVNNYGAVATLSSMMSGLALSHALDWGRWYIQSSTEELEQSIESESSESTEPGNSVISNCIRFFKPKRYNIISQVKKIHDADTLTVSNDEFVHLNEQEPMDLNQDELEISDEEFRRCRCTLF